MAIPSPSDEESHPHPSALQTLLNTHTPPPGTEPTTYHLALQIAHNLKYQHRWMHLRIHTHQSTSTTTSHSTDLRAASPRQRLPRPLISGIPPKRLYIHPDEQLALLQQEKREGRKAGELVGGKGRGEREWVLPSHLREKWSLKRFGEVFDAVGRVPTMGEGEEVLEEDAKEPDSEEAGEGNKWRTDTPKRLLLATLDDDSTVVYYIVHDGIVKPRQN